MVKVTRVAPKLVHNRGLSLSMTGGAGGAVYVPYLVQHHTCLVKTEGNVNFFGTKSLVYCWTFSVCSTYLDHDQVNVKGFQNIHSCIL